jgi:uncharacterized protein YuzE
MMRFTYDKEADAAYIYFESIPPRGVKKTVELNDSVFLDFNSKKRLVGVEILSASKVLSKKALSTATSH